MKTTTASRAAASKPARTTVAAPGQHSASTVQAPCWPDGKPRSTGGPFDILYQPRATPKAASAPGKRGPKPSQSYHARTLATLREPKHSSFCTSIARQSDSDKTRRIKAAQI